MAAVKTLDILGLGGVAVDDVIYVTDYPPADAKARVVGRQRHCGGLTAVALISAARLGGSCAYAGVLGRDELSQFGLDCMKAEKIDVSAVRRATSARPIYSNIVVDPWRGTRNIFFDLREVVGARDDVSASLIEKARVLFVDHLGVEAMIRAARMARRAGVPVVGDFEVGEHPRFGELLRLTDHLVLSREFVATLTGKKSAEGSTKALASAGHEAVIVTCGAEGCWFWERGMNAPAREKAFKVKAVDTTGCGDVFHGAYAFALARRMPIEERIRLASAAAALKASRGGGIEGIPTMAKVQRLMNR